MFITKLFCGVGFMNKTKDDALQTRAQLLDSAYQIFLEKGYASASLAEIAQNAGLTRGAAYWHFKNKDDLYICVITDALNRMMDKKNMYAASSDLPDSERVLGMLSLPITLADDYCLVNSVSLLLPHYSQFQELYDLVLQRKQNMQDFFLSFYQQLEAEHRAVFHGTVQNIAAMSFLLFEGLYFHNHERNNIGTENLKAFIDTMITFC